MATAANSIATASLGLMQDTRLLQYVPLEGIIRSLGPRIGGEQAGE
jgi:hypothetical protein